MLSSYDSSSNGTLTKIQFQEALGKIPNGQINVTNGKWNEAYRKVVNEDEASVDYKEFLCLI